MLFSSHGQIVFRFEKNRAVAPQSKNRREKHILNIHRSLVRPFSRHDDSTSEPFQRRCQANEATAFLRLETLFSGSKVAAQTAQPDLWSSHQIKSLNREKDWRMPRCKKRTEASPAKSFPKTVRQLAASAA